MTRTSICGTTSIPKIPLPFIIKAAIGCGCAKVYIVFVLALCWFYGFAKTLTRFPTQGLVQFPNRLKIVGIRVSYGCCRVMVTCGNIRVVCPRLLRYHSIPFPPSVGSRSWNGSVNSMRWGPSLVKGFTINGISVGCACRISWFGFQHHPHRLILT